MSTQTELARGAIQNLLDGAKNPVIFQRQTRIGDAVYLQLITAFGFVSFRAPGISEPDTKITGLTDPTTWVRMFRGRVMMLGEAEVTALCEDVRKKTNKLPTRDEFVALVGKGLLLKDGSKLKTLSADKAVCVYDLLYGLPAERVAIITKVADQEAMRVHNIMSSTNAPMAPASAINDKTAAVLTKENQVCLWLQDDVADASISAVKSAAWTRNVESLSGVYGFLNSKIRKLRATQPNIDAISVGVLNGHCVFSMRDSSHSMLITTNAATPDSFPQCFTYADGKQFFSVKLNGNGTYETTEITEEQMKAKLTDPKVLLTPASAPAPKAEAPVEAPTPPAAPVTEPERTEAVAVAPVAPVVAEPAAPAPAPVEASVETAEHEVSDPITPTASETITKPEPVAEPAIDDQLDALSTVFTDIIQTCRLGATIVKSVKKRYKEESKLIKRNAKESEEFVSMKAKLDKAISDKDKAVAQLNKIKSLISID